MRQHIFRKGQLTRCLTLCAVLLLSVSMFACGDKDRTEEGSSTAEITVPETDAPATAPESDTATGETPPAEVTQEEEPVTELPTLSPAEPVLSEGFAYQPVYRPTPVERNDTISVKLGGVILEVDYKSTFLGTESVVDRDTDHWGNLTRKTMIGASALETPFVLGDMDGDRVCEVITFEEGVLTIYRLKTNNRQNPLSVQCTQSLGFEGFLCGSGLFNNDLYTDLLLWHTDAGQLVLALGGADGFTYALIGCPEGLPTDTETLTQSSPTVSRLMTGDVDGDGVTDLVLVNGMTVSTWLYRDGGFVPLNQTTLLYTDAESIVDYSCGDINSDGTDDICCYFRTGDTDDSGNALYAMRTWYGRRNGQFGPTEAEGDNKNLYVTSVWEEGCQPLFMAAGDVTGDGVDDVCVPAITPSRNNKVYLYMSVYPEEAPAYDYSTHIVKTDTGYIWYSGGMYYDYNTDTYHRTEADHILAYTSEDGLTWHRNLDSACFYLGGELGEDGQWWTGNTMEPEVLFVDGVWYMYYQVENYSYTTTGQLMGWDRIGVATSTDGIHFTRHTEEPVIVTTDQYSCFTHEEVIYVPDDPDGKCFWMYVRYVHDNSVTKFMRIRSADPYHFNLEEDGEAVSGWHQIGNQVGYISDYDGKGNRLFLRITFAEEDFDGTGARVHTVPTLQFSLDGLRWITSNIRMAGCDLDDPREAERPNMYFLGMSTLNGTGEIEKTEDGQYRIIYGGCTANSPVAPGIFYSSEGMGIMTFTLSPNP